VQIKCPVFAQFPHFTARKHGGLISYFQMNKDDHGVLHRINLAVNNNSNDKMGVKMTMIVAVHQKLTREELNNCIGYALIYIQSEWKCILVVVEPINEVQQEKRRSLLASAITAMPSTSRTMKLTQRIVVPPSQQHLTRIPSRPL
jgi:hypothetical protein